MEDQDEIDEGKEAFKRVKVCRGMYVGLMLGYSTGTSRGETGNS
jgi:hypothetical protein